MMSERLAVTDQVKEALQQAGPQILLQDQTITGAATVAAEEVPGPPLPRIYLVEAGSGDAAGPVEPCFDRPILADLAKRAFDLVLSFLLLMFLAPVILLIAVTLKLRYGGPVLYGHRRIGRGDTEFNCFKFRSMYPDADRILADCLESDARLRDEWETTQKLKCDPRVHRVGKILRKSSLDELPQLFNVLIGDMSLVGPRPIVRAEMRNYGQFIRYYLAARPGITGLWQVSGRNNTTYDERVALDVRYVREMSLALDLRILLRTVRVVLTGHGAY